MLKLHNEDFHKKENRFSFLLKNCLKDKHSDLAKLSNLRDARNKNNAKHMLTIYYHQKSRLWI